MSSFKTRAFKIASFTFMGFIIILIVISFGMPNLSQSSNQNDFFVAKVGDEVITKSDVARVGQQLKARNQNASEEIIKRQAIEHNVYRKLFMYMMKQYGMYPRGDSRNKIIAEYIKMHFSKYYENGKFNLKKFRDEYLYSRRITFSEMEHQTISEYAYNLNYRLFLNFGTFSSAKDTESENMINSVKISYTTAFLDEDTIKNYAVQQNLITSKSIKEKFENDYNKDKKNKISYEKRLLVINELYQSNKDQIITTIKDSIKNEKNKSIHYLSAKYRMKTIHINDISYATRPASKSSELAGIEYNDQYQQIVAGIEKNKLSDPVFYNGKIFLFQITDRVLPENDATLTNKRNNYLFTVFDQMMEAIRNDTEIVRYSG